MEMIRNQRFDEERALYGSHNVGLVDCTFDGPADGESAFKESRDVAARRCFFNLRYPFWHNRHLLIDGCEMTELCRAALWYCDDVDIRATQMRGIKAVRECSRVRISDCDIVSPEFGWFTNAITLSRCAVQSEYLLMRSRDVRMEGVTLNGKYSLQYVDGGEITDCHLVTKDSLWHSKGVTVRDSVLEGEYLAWYSEGLTLINCTIRGTQPFCYCKGLKLVNCVMEQTDLAFEKSEVEATICSVVDSVKNPRRGNIVVVGLGELIRDDPDSYATVEVQERPGTV